jgi:twinkle protein
MTVMLTDDQIDFEAYMLEPEARQLVKPASHWRDKLVDSFNMPETQRGTFLPWRKTHGLFRLRRSELTVWSGINGHGKSILLSQVMASAMEQGETSLIASMEMRPELTLNRMARQWTTKREPVIREIDAFNAWTEDRLWIYDKMGAVQWKKLLAVCRWAADKLAITHFVIDSLMRCGIADDDYGGQKAFVDALCTFKSDYNVAVHLVMHARKGQDEYAPPGKFDAKGTGTMTDLADNVMTVWRNKKKEAEIETLGARGQPIGEDLRRQPDALLICDKQRNFDWEGRIALWYHRDSMQYVQNGVGDGAQPSRFDGEAI